MVRRALLLALTAVVLVTVSGCTGGGQPGIDNSAITAAIGAVIEGFKADIEAYDMDETDGALSCLSGADFVLTLKETGFPEYTKTYATLKSELEEDAPAQLAWREGLGYGLTLRIDKKVFSNVNATGAFVTHDFWVDEWTHDIPLRTTDWGTMTWQFAKISGAWKATRMSITFKPVQAGPASIQAAGSGARGFGFGAGPYGL